MGVVYLGLDPSGRKVAVKVISPALASDPVYRARFDAEAVNAQRVASFCTARVLDHGEADGLAYLVTEYIDGPSLTRHVEAHGALPPDELRSLAAGVAAALTAIHAVHLVHRDLKPANVLLAADGPRVIDFGIARALDSQIQHTQTGVVIGSPGYLAPEQAFGGRVGTAADVFSWGTLVAFAATGRNPFGTGTLPVLAVRAQHGEYDLTGVPADLVPLVRAALDPDPERRPTAEDLLVRLVGERETQAAAVDLVHRHWPPAPNPTTPYPPTASPPTVNPNAVSPAAPYPAELRPPGVRPTASDSTASDSTLVVPSGARAGGAGSRRWKAVAAGTAALAALGATATAVYALNGGSSGDPHALASTPPPGSSTPTARTTVDSTPTDTPTPGHWREIGGLDRMDDYCGESGKTVTYTDGGREWWCEDSAGGLQRLDLQVVCAWHYPSFKKIRVRERPDPGPIYEVHWYCEGWV